MKMITQRVPLPLGVSAAAAIGQRGRPVRTIGIAHSIRCVVDVDANDFVLKGLSHNVHRALEDVIALFSRILEAGQVPVNEGDSSARERASLIHRTAAMVNAQSEWCFKARSSCELTDDDVVKYFKFCLDQSLGRESAVDKPASIGWIEKYDLNFQQRMIADLASLEGEEAGKTLKVMTGFGLTCLLARSGFGRSADVICSVAVSVDITVQATLVERVKCHDDVIVKYNYNDELRQWEPVPAETLQRRVTRALYDIAVENGTSIRIRAYSRDDGRGHDMIPHLDAWMPPNGSPFDTVVTPRSSFPSISFVRHVLIKKKCGVVSHGLRFTLNYLDKFSTRINIQCRPLDQTDTEAAIPTLSDSMQFLLGKMLLSLSRSGH